MLEPITEIDGLPLFKIDQDMEQSHEAALQEIFDSGHTMFYLLASKRISGTYTDSKKDLQKWTSYRPAIFKCSKNLIGWGVAEFDADLEDLDVLGNTARFVLPTIPGKLIDRIDRFFRYIDQTNRTEAIVLFTYDTNYLGKDNAADGWGILVPDQQNSSGHCNYDPVSVMSEKPDDVRIVGTAHSHPQMAAFCSGTDKGDQEGFDGVHITFGWKGNGPTEFHCEVQLADYGFKTFRDEDIFEVPKGTEVDEEILEWAKRVSVFNQNQTAAVVSAVTSNAASFQGRHEITNQGYSWDDPCRFPNLPPGCPSPRAVTFVWYHALPLDQIEECAVCEQKLTEYTYQSQKCSGCSTYFVGADQSMEDMMKRRLKANNARVTELQAETASKPIYEYHEKLGVVEIFEGDPAPLTLLFTPEEEEGEEDNDITDDVLELYKDIPYQDVTGDPRRESEDGDEQWTCDGCDVSNHELEVQCWMCHTPRTPGLAS